MAGPLDEAFVEITAELDTRQMQRAAARAGRDVERELVRSVGRAENSLGRQGKRIGDSLGDGIGSGLSSTLSSIAGIKLPTGGFVVLGGAMSAAAAAAVQLAAALAPAVGIVATLPAVAGVAAAGMATLNVATAGVGEAFAAAAGTEEEFNEALEGLAPNAQAAAQAIRDMMPQLDALRTAVQDAFFSDFDKVLNTLAAALIGPVTAGMVSVADQMNGIILGLAAVATSAVGVDFVNQSFEIMGGILARLQEPLAALFESLLNVGVAIGDAFGENAGADLANLITRFAEFLDQAAASGQAVQWVSDALAVFQAIQDILSPIAGIISSIGKAAATTGAGILGVFGEVLQTFDDFLASAEGQDVLITIFEALNQVGSAFATVLKNIAPALVPIINGIAGILSVVSPLLGPLSELVGSILTALAPILTVIAEAIEPIIEPLTTVIELLGGILAEAITSVMPLIQLLADLLGAGLTVVFQVIAEVLAALAPIFTALAEAMAPVMEALQPLFEIFGMIAELVGTVLSPIIQVLGDILMWLVENVVIPYLIPTLEMMAQILTVVLGGAIKWVGEQFELAGQGLKIIFDFIAEHLSNTVDVLIAGWEAFVIAFQVGKAAVDRLVFTPLKNGINAVKDTISDALDNIKDGWSGFVDNTKAIPGKIASALRDMFSPLWEGFRNAINNVISGWNNLSFSVPSVDLGPLGSVGGFTVSTPNIPYLAQGALATGPTLAMVGEGRYSEAILPLGDPRVDTLLASALSRAGVQNQSVSEANGGAVNATGISGDTYFMVKIGEREITDIVVEQMDETNQMQLRRARAGTGRRT